MSKKQLFVLGLLATGTAVVLIMMTFLLIDRNRYTRLSNPTLVSTIALEIAKNTDGQSSGTPLEEANVIATGYPAGDGDHPLGSEPDMNQLPPENIPTGEAMPGGAGAQIPNGADSSSAYPAVGQGGGIIDWQAGNSGQNNQYPNGYPAPGTGNTGVTITASTSIPTPTNIPTLNSSPTIITTTATQAASTPTITGAHVSATPTPPVSMSATPTNSPVNPTRTATATLAIQPAGQPTQSPSTVPNEAAALISVRAASEPRLDGSDQDAVWANAAGLIIETRGGVNNSNTQVTIKSVYTQERVYFLLTWKDPSHSFLSNPWEKLADGSWKVLVDPKNRGNDENVYYEDKIAFLWPIQNSIPNFAQAGCGGLCHAGENADVKAYGNMYTAGDGQLADLWQWRSVRDVGQIDDQYLDNTHYTKNQPYAGLQTDPKQSGGFTNNQTADRKSPADMAPGGGDKTGAPGFLLNTEKVALDPSLFKTGDRVPGVITGPFIGDRGDISAGWKYADGQWTLEFSRKLVTGSKYDVQFDDLSKTYFFGLATFDNTQMRHAFQNGATAFKFQK